MNVSSIDLGSTYGLIRDGIKASNTRAEVIANNMANINTKGYKKFDVIFEENLKKVSDEKNLQLKTTKDKHLRANGETNNNIGLQRVNTTSMRSDGNNVDLELEKVNQAANTLKYNALITKINGKFNNMKSVIK